MFVVSDLHAVSEPLDSAISYARTWTRSEPSNALTAAKNFVVSSGLTADLVLCPGDLGNVVDEKGMTYAWETLGEIAGHLNADATIGTAGNHDVVRPSPTPGSGFDPNEHLKRLSPPFPCGDAAGRTEYFNEDFVVVTGDRWRVISLNSCAEFGHKDRHLHGSVRDKTLLDLEEVMRDEPRDVNVLLCHHHPVQWTRYARDDTSHMRAGDRLLDLLDRDHNARWLLVHGHKHYPALGYVGESTSGPARFSAGSLSVQLYPELRDKEIKNQMYMLEFDLDELDSLDLRGGGRFEAWDWGRRSGFRSARRASGLPASGGFGFRRDGRELAQLALETAKALGERVVPWPELVKANARWRYVAPLDLDALERDVTKLDGYAHFEDDGTVREISFARI